ncbi:MAG: signal peptide peptidase SppA [Halothiobacillaceae bacterium]
MSDLDKIKAFRHDEELGLGSKNSLDDTWMRNLLGKLAESSLVEQRRARRWGIFFKLAFLAYAMVLLFIMVMGNTEDTLSDEPFTALVTLDGAIMSDTEANADTVIEGLRKGFESEHSKAVILRINSPGGSPVQSNIIYQEMRRLREKYPEKPLYVVVTEMAASGGYYIAAGATAIYADQASIVGSIGVRMEGFGVVDAMKKLGIEYRELTAGDHKALLSPFVPVNEEEKAHMEGLLNEVHQQFIKAVKDGRGERLHLDTPGLFSGLIWTGQQSVDLGLIDGLGTVESVARDVVKAAKVVNVTSEQSVLDRLFDRMGVATSAAVSTGITKALIESQHGVLH